MGKVKKLMLITKESGSDLSHFKSSVFIVVKLHTKRTLSLSRKSDILCKSLLCGIHNLFYKPRRVNVPGAKGNPVRIKESLFPVADSKYIYRSMPYPALDIKFMSVIIFLGKHGFHIRSPAGFIKISADLLNAIYYYYSPGTVFIQGFYNHGKRHFRERLRIKILFKSGAFRGWYSQLKKRLVSNAFIPVIRKLVRFYMIWNTGLFGDICRTFKKKV